MKVVFRHWDFTRVGHFQSILESEGIPTQVKNQDLVTMVTEVPIPEFYPALYVMNDRDYEQALEILSEFSETKATVVDHDMGIPRIVAAGVTLILGLGILQLIAFGYMELKPPPFREPNLIALGIYAILVILGGLIIRMTWKRVHGSASKVADDDLA